MFWWNVSYFTTLGDASCIAVYIESSEPCIRRFDWQDRWRLRILFSTQVVFVKMFLQLCINYLQCIFAAVLAWIGGRVPQMHNTSQLSSTGKVNPATIKEVKNISQAAATPSSVNYHFTRQCNYKCGFCFHTAKTSFVLPIEEAKRGLQLLKESGKFAQILYLCYFKSIFKFTWYVMTLLL